MEHIINKIIQESRTKSKYRKWASQLFIASICLNIILIALSIKYIDEINFEEVLYLHSFLGLITFLIGSAIIYLGLKIKEDKSYQYSVSIWGLFVFILPIFAVFIYN